MLKRRFCFSLVTCSMLVSPTVAQVTCTPDQFAKAIDDYAAEPFGVNAWRQMTGLGNPELPGESYAYDSYAATDTWRKLVAEVAPGNQSLADPGYNCRMTYPTSVLKMRIGSFGKDSDYVKQWLKGQEAVVQACANNPAALPELQVPANLKPGELDLLKFDRAYQEASVLFYNKPSDAVVAFKAIAASASPHKATARYNVANLLANAKNVIESRREARAILADPALEPVHDITQELLGYIANLEDTAQGWSELIDDTVKTLSQPVTAIKGKPKAEAQFSKALYDIGFAGVTDKRDDWWVTNTLPADATLSKAIADGARKHPMVLWMLAGQSIRKPQTITSWAFMGPKWQSWNASYVDRAMALQSAALPELPRNVLQSLKATTDDASRAALWSKALAAAEKTSVTCGEAPETAAVTQLALQAVRVSAMAGQYGEIYSNLPKLKLDGSKSLSLTVLPKLMEHLIATGNVEEGRRLRDAFLTDPFLKSFETNGMEWERGTYAEFMGWVAEDEAQWLKSVAVLNEKLSPVVFNLLPAAKLRELAGNAIFSAEQNALLKRAAWTRNYARGVRNSDKTTNDMLAANTELATALAAVNTERPALKADHALLLTILRNPRFGILVNSPDGMEPMEAKRESFAALDSFDPNDKNWWCPLEPDRQLGALRARYDQASSLDRVKSDSKMLAPVLEADAVTKAEVAREAVLKQHPMVKAVSWKEVARLAAAPSAPKLLAQSAIRWGKASKVDDGAAEALALAVRATRYGCRWHGSVKAYSKPAQELLKAKFATTTWAAQTPYWFDCTDSTYDAQYNKVPNCKPRSWPAQKPPR